MAAQERPGIEYRTPVDLVRDVLSGAVRIPWFQRGFQWEASDVVKLFDSVARGFPIGDLLFWLRPASAQRLSVGPIEVDAPGMVAARWVVDGQQRIAALVGALVAAQTSTDHRFRVHLDVDTGEFHAIGPRDEPPGHWVPVNVLIDETARQAWIGASQWLDDAQIARADGAAEAIRGYRIPVYLVESVDEAAVREMFERINTGGRRLGQREVFEALQDGSARDHISTIGELVDLIRTTNFGVLDHEVAETCARAFDDGRRSLDDVAAALRATVDFLRGEVGIPHVWLLHDPGVLPLLVRFVGVHGAPAGRAAVLLRRWLWRSAVAVAHGDRLSPPDPAMVSDRRDPVDAASMLLSVVPSYPKFRLDFVMTGVQPPWFKLVLLSLAAQSPREFGTGRRVDVAALINRGPCYTEILDLPPSGATSANVILHPRLDGAVVDALRNASTEVAASHLIDDQARQLLIDGEDENFLARRAKAVAEAVRRNVDGMAEWGARDGRAVTDVIRSVA